MKITQFEDVREFQNRAEPVLGGREAEYPLAIGLLAELAEKGWQGRYDAPPLLVLVEDQDRPVGLAIRTQPQGITLTALPAEAMPALTRWLRERQIDPPWVLAPKSAAEAFALHWAQVAGKHSTLKHTLRTHALRRVIMPAMPPGWMRQATEADFQLLVSWTEGFTRDIGHPPEDEGPGVQ